MIYKKREEKKMEWYWIALLIYLWWGCGVLFTMLHFLRTEDPSSLEEIIIIICCGITGIIAMFMYIADLIADKICIKRN